MFTVKTYFGFKLFIKSKMVLLLFKTETQTIADFIIMPTKKILFLVL